MLRRDDLVSPSRQDKNAGNSGDLIKHISYLALIRELWQMRELRIDSGRYHIVEAHAGKGVYVSTHHHLFAARRLENYFRSTFGKAQAACFAPEPGGLGPIFGLQTGEVAYAGSTALHALAVISDLCATLTVMDSDKGVQQIVGGVFSQPCFAGIRPRLEIQDPGGDSEPVILSKLAAGQFGSGHILHFDPFAFVMAGKDAVTRATYRDLIRECDARIGKRELAAASVFFTWGSNGAAAKDDLYGRGYLGGQHNGFQELVSLVSPERRIVVIWCWELYFSLLLIVPNELKAALRPAIETEALWIRPLMRCFNVVV
jgi:hypothetical protein